MTSDVSPNPVRVDYAGNGQAVLYIRIRDGMAAGQNAARLPHLLAASQEDFPQHI